MMKLSSIERSAYTKHLLLSQFYEYTNKNLEENKRRHVTNEPDCKYKLSFNTKKRREM